MGHQQHGGFGEEPPAGRQKNLRNGKTFWKKIEFYLMPPWQFHATGKVLILALQWSNRLGGQEIDFHEIETQIFQEDTSIMRLKVSIIFHNFDQEV
jgi:hypothetical protein